MPGEHADKLRDEIGPMIRSLNGAAGYHDANGHGLAFNVGVGTGSIGGAAGISLPTLYALLNPAQSVLPMAAPPAAALPGPVAGVLPQATTGGNR